MLRLLTRGFAELKPQHCYYKVLNLPPYCSVTDVRVAYLDLAKRFHPDLNKSPEAASRFGEIQKAYEVLSDDDSRRLYDQANLVGKELQQEQSQEPKMSAAEMEKHREHFKQKHLHGEENKRKDELNDELNFSYRLFRTHFEKVQSKKDDYERFAVTRG